MFLFFIISLFVLAIADLVVGVSNDAVNFLNSAIGSKAGARKLILAVAAVGVFAGAFFSSGIMEVARKGIFNPQMFTFSEVMVIFMAVMLTDILLLDIFNTLGLPTSTTVSIIFELLGAAVVISLIKVVSTGVDLSEVANYINSSKAIMIIASIFLSVIIAFTVGIIGQFLSRLVFGFHYKRRLKKYGGIWGGIALTILSYFLLIKGMKGASFISDAMIIWIDKNSLLLLFCNLIFWSATFQVLVKFTKVDVLKVIVLVGTFSLAMAFASNDLVNFIGVPIAGFESFQMWNTSGKDVNMLMTGLSGKVQTSTYILTIAGLIMVAALWLSKKARRVTATEVNLGRQGKGDERFNSNFLAKVIVRVFSLIVKEAKQLMPQKMHASINKKYRPKRYSKQLHPPAFDMIRASVNLTLASMIISLATINKLPLSTTYVSFMVAMGTSLADRAWGNSAEYRVAGVVSVITGWFITAFVAFIVAGLFAFLLFNFGITALLILICILVLIMYLTSPKIQLKTKNNSVDSDIPNLSGV
jgi:phosphate/sulfate permease